MSSRVSVRGELQYDADLFEKLRGLRKSMADEANLPAYTIFHDSSLREMAAFCPKTLDEFRDIRGVGDAKSERYGARFIAVIAEHVADETTPQTRAAHTPYDGPEVDAPELRPRTRQVVACYLDTRSLAEAGSQLDISPNTVAGHLERYLQAGYDLPLEPLMAESTLTDDQRTEVLRLMDESNRESMALKPIFEHFDGEISYFELRILLLWHRILASRKQVT